MGRRSFLETPPEDRIRTALREQVILTRTRAASKGGCSPKWADTILQGLITDGVARFEPPQEPGAFKGDYRDVDREATTILVHWALAEQVHALFGHPSSELGGPAYRLAMWAIKWRWRLGPIVMEAIGLAALAAPHGVTQRNAEEEEKEENDRQPYYIGLPSWAGERLLEALEADPPPRPLTSMEFAEFRDWQRRLLFRWLEGETD